MKNLIPEPITRDDGAVLGWYVSPTTTPGIKFSITPATPDEVLRALADWWEATT